MLALRKVAPRPGVAIENVDAPEMPSRGEVLVQVAAVGICGTDLHIDDWADGFHAMASALPVTLGHEFCGRVHAVGEGVTAFKAGDRVVVQPAIGCGKCAPCQAGARHDCLNRSAIGMHRAGGFAKYVSAPADYCIAMPPGMSDLHGALVEPLTTGAQAVKIGEVKEGDRVTVFGPGPIGQGAAAMARLAGAAEVHVVGYRDGPRFATLRKMGFDSFTDLADDDGEATLRKVARGGFDVAIDASGAPSVINTGLSVLKPYGVFVIASMPDHEAPLDVMLLVRGRTQLRGCSRAPDWAWADAIEALSKNPALFAPMVTHELALEEGLEGFRLMRSREASKVILRPNAS
ncbi:zinc-dependent alcohol dehydrogenase [Terricaulis silvestris]|uniref:L-threonine 3-dehydrogenase n=1 Tax=Terricaulis silvestris TaxID=2686094 RepID=A0A6I6MKK2_9CAUL|nr:alcohol dehydrogenase catalytic domain-containing protein [Terricaulis silvestris]QGZ93676.1 L-threonine 3-dehydrogenase [Terricaulis silvestris]